MHVARQGLVFKGWGEDVAVSVCCVVASEVEDAGLGGCLFVPCADLRGPTDQQSFCKLESGSSV